jgi:hypothetical protein
MPQVWPMSDLKFHPEAFALVWPPVCARILALSANGATLCGLPEGHDGPHGGPHWTGSQGIDAATLGHLEFVTVG